MFRGIVFLDADETIKLPLTTTKRGIDTTSDVYKMIFSIIKEATISVVPFLKEITKLKDEANNYRELLAEKKNRISVVELKSINFMAQEYKKFISPSIDLDEIAQDVDKVHISYEVSKEIANKARSHSKTKTLKDLEITTFNYYIKMEELDDE